MPIMPRECKKSECCFTVIVKITFEFLFVLTKNFISHRWICLGCDQASVQFSEHPVQLGRDFPFIVKSDISGDWDRLLGAIFQRRLRSPKPKPNSQLIKFPPFENSDRQTDRQTDRHTHTHTHTHKTVPDTCTEHHLQTWHQQSWDGTCQAGESWQSSEGSLGCWCWTLAGR